MGEGGRSYYLTRQIPLDTVYPALLALTMVSMLRWLEKRDELSVLARIGIALSVGAALFDYGENLGIILIISGWPSISDILAHTTSTASIAKSFLTTSAVLALILVGTIQARQRRADHCN